MKMNEEKNLFCSMSSTRVMRVHYSIDEGYFHLNWCKLKILWHGPQVLLVRKYENDFAETKNITICAWLV